MLKKKQKITFSHLSDFGASLFNGVFDLDNISDYGADSNFISCRILKQEHAETGSFRLARIKLAHVYWAVTQDPCWLVEKILV